MIQRIIIILILFAGSVQAQQKYWVFFKDKTTEGFDPYSYFDQKAIERRQRNHLPLYDYSDVPVKPEYHEKVASIADSISATSRWFNAIVVYASNEQIRKISEYSFVDSVRRGGLLNPLIMGVSGDVMSEKELKMLDYQTYVLGRDDLKKENLTGKGVRIAVFDAGYDNADKNKSFDHLRADNRILKTYDFIKNRDHVYDYSDHGTMVLSCIAGIHEGRNIGLATGSEIMLARTEYNVREPFSEEEHWVEAAEWADKNGADIISSSLGYTQSRYFQTDLDGKTSLVSRAATMAARKGILVVNAAGNDGSSEWKKLGVPGDADSILTVGGTDPYTGMHVNFSSYGPTTDKRLKPNVSAPGIVIAAVDEKIGQTQGTSFSTPLISGLAACVLERNKDWTCQELLHSIEKAGRLHPYYDYAHGYGIPRAAYFTGDSMPHSPTFTADVNEGSLKVTIDSGYVSNDASDLLYYHVREPSGYIHKYYVLKLTSSDPIMVNVSEFKNMIIAIHFKGFTTEISIK